MALHPPRRPIMCHARIVCKDPNSTQFSTKCTRSSWIMYNKNSHRAKFLTSQIKETSVANGTLENSIHMYEFEKSNLEIPALGVR